MSARRGVTVAALGAALAAVVTLAGCSSPEAAPAPPDSAAAVGASAQAARSAGAPAGSPDALTGAVPGAVGGGVSADRARASGRFVAEYDAKVEAGRDQRRGGSRVVTITNVGTRDDTYTVSLTPPGSGTVTPATVAAASGEGFQVVVTPTAATELVVLSRGRGGEVVRQPVTP